MASKFISTYFYIYSFIIFILFSILLQFPGLVLCSSLLLRHFYFKTENCWLHIRSLERNYGKKIYNSHTNLYSILF